MLCPSFGNKKRVIIVIRPGDISVQNISICGESSDDKTTHCEVWTLLTTALDFFLILTSVAVEKKTLTTERL